MVEFQKPRRSPRSGSPKVVGLIVLFFIVLTGVLWIAWSVNDRRPAGDPDAVVQPAEVPEPLPPAPAAPAGS